VVLLKGPTTVVAAPDGRVRLARSGDDRLATAGTGDVLTGIIAALLAGGLDPLDAAAVGAHVHGLAGRAAPRHGTMATDVIDGIPVALGHLLGDGR
jgi:NAD(P)H-hydrate repair Nnr-like enzyme with NAD(P)H-hydrate dehydratase domain